LGAPKGALLGPQRGARGGPGGRAPGPFTGLLGPGNVAFFFFFFFHGVFGPFRVHRPRRPSLRLGLPSRQASLSGFAGCRLRIKRRGDQWGLGPRRGPRGQTNALFEGARCRIWGLGAPEKGSPGGRRPPGGKPASPLPWGLRPRRGEKRGPKEPERGPLTLEKRLFSGPRRGPEKAEKQEKKGRKEGETRAKRATFGPAGPQR